MKPIYSRRGFSLVEVVIAVAIGAIVVGSGMMLYLQGNKYFYKTTEHSSFRAESLVILERIADDLHQLQVSAGKDPETGQYLLVQPFRFLDPISGGIPLKDVDGNVIETVPAGKGIRFYRFHHIEMVPDPGLPNGKPQMVGRPLEYKQVPVDPSGPTDPADPNFAGVNLLRNGEKINSIPLQQVLFHSEPMIVAANQVQGSRNAIVSVSVVPKGGVFGNMDYNTLQRLQKEGALATRTMHLTGYESFYTSVLYSAILKNNGVSGSISGVDPLMAAVYNDAQTSAPPGMLSNLNSVAEGGAPPSQTISPDTFKIETKAYQQSTAAVDTRWMSVPQAPGTEAGEGEIEIPASGSGSGSGSGSASSEGSGSG